MVENGNFTLLLTSSGQEWQFHIATDVKWSRMAISHLLLTCSCQKLQFTLLLTYSGQEWQFHILLLTSSCQEWQFHIATDVQWSRMAISHCY